MPRLGSFSSRSLTGVGVSLPIVEEPVTYDNPYPTISLSNEAWKFKVNAGTLPYLPDTSQHAWNQGVNYRSTTNLSVVSGGAPIDSAGNMLYNAGSTGGIATLASATYADWHNSNIAGHDYALEAHINVPTLPSFVMHSIEIFSTERGSLGLTLTGTPPSTAQVGAYIATAVVGTGVSITGYSVNMADFTYNTWHHFVIQRKYISSSLSKYYVYLNGVHQGTFTDTTGGEILPRNDFANYNGAYVGSAGGEFFPYYVDNIRMIQGAPFYFREGSFITPDTPWQQPLDPVTSFSGRMISLGPSTNATSANLVPAYAVGSNTTWTSASTTPTSFLGANVTNWASYTVAASDGTTCLIINGQSGTTASTTDGATWTSKTTLTNPSSQYWNSLVYGEGRFVTIYGGGNVNSTLAAYSDNAGTSWTTVTVPAGRWCQLAYGNGRFVVLDLFTPASVIYSDDGATWSTGGSLPNGLPTAQFKNSFFFAGGSVSKFLNVREANTDTMNVAASSDGVTWTSTTGTALGITIFSTPYTAFNKAGSGRLVMVQSYSNYSWYSDDVGATWTRVDNPFTTGKLAFTGLYFYNNVFIATTRTASGQTSVTYISGDGIAWTEGGTSTGIANLGSISYLVA